MIDGIAHANAFAVADPYRAATHNKGILNGIDAVAVATGNDWRAIEAGAHAYAARDGQYRALTEWRVIADKQPPPAKRSNSHRAAVRGCTAVWSCRWQPESSAAPPVPTRPPSSPSSCWGSSMHASWAK